jgi:hypothetical protein
VNQLAPHTPAAPGSSTVSTMSEHPRQVTDDIDLRDPANLEQAKQVPDSTFTGSVLIQLIDQDGNVKDERRTGNLITDAGDLYYAGKAIALGQPANPAAPTIMSGMKLGTGTTAVAKAGAGAALVTYITGSNNPFDASFPATQNLGAGLGVNGQYKTSWLAGDVTNSAITEAVIVNDAATDATSTAANTAHRIVFTAINKLSTDTLVITWNAKFLGV